MKRGDGILILTILLIATIGGAYLYLQKQQGYVVEITRDTIPIMTLPIDTPTTVPIHDEDSGAYHLIEITNTGEVTVLESNCPDLLCVAHRNISAVKEMIVCLPHRVVVQVVE